METIISCEGDYIMQNLKNSQNFLVDKKLVNELVVKSKINNTDRVIEIGPGKGTITGVLAQYAKEVIAVEYDKALFEGLLSHHSSNNVEYVYGDILQYKLPIKGEYKVFSNIPFQITANIIKKLTEAPNPPKEIFLIVQKEAAKKYCGIPFQRYEGLRAAIVKAQYGIEIVHSFKRKDFVPAPNVDTVLLHFTQKNDKLSLAEYSEYKDIVSYLYSSNKGETAKDRLALLFSNMQVRRLCKDNNISEMGSFTCITSEQWIKIYEYSKIGLTDEKRKKLRNSYIRLEKNNKGLKKQNRTSFRKPRKKYTM